jgi:hypothetical protein
MKLLMELFSKKTALQAKLSCAKRACSLVVDCSGTTPHDDDRVSQCLRGGLSRHLSHVAVRVILFLVRSIGHRGRARPGLSSPRSIALLSCGPDRSSRTADGASSRLVPSRSDAYQHGRPPASHACTGSIGGETRRRPPGNWEETSLSPSASSISHGKNFLYAS